MLRTPATPGPVGARQRLPCAVHTRADSTSSHTAAHKHSSTHIRTVLQHISVRSWPSTRTRRPCSNGLEEAMIRANCTVIARSGGSSAACQCAMQMVFNAMHCVTRKAALQLAQWHWHADGHMDGLLRRRRLEQHVHGCRAPLRGSLAMSRIPLRCSAVGASHGRSDDIIGGRQCRKTGCS